MRRWDEIRIRQHRLMADVEAQQTTPAHIDHIMRSGFTMSDIKGLNRNFEDGTEADEMLQPSSNPSRPPRKGSLTRTGSQYERMDDNVRMQRSTSALNMDNYQSAEAVEEDKGDKKRGRSPFRFFKKNRDQSKDKLKSKSPDGMDRMNERGGGRNVVQSSMSTRAPTVRISDVSDQIVCFSQVVSDSLKF